MSVARLLTGLALALSLAGCGTIQDKLSDWSGNARKDGTTPAKLEDFKARAKVVVNWHQSVGAAEFGVLQPAASLDAVYAASGKGKLQRFDRNTGKHVWSVDTHFSVTGGVGLGEGLVLVGGEKGEVAAYDEEGKPRWQVTVSSEVSSAPQVSDGIVVVRSGDGHIVGLSVVDGSRQWVYERSLPPLIARSHASVTLVHGVVLAGYPAGKLAAIDLKTGMLLWDTTVSQPKGNTELERISDITSPVVADDEAVCAVSFQGRLGCFDLTQGTLRWSRDVSSDKGLNLLLSRLYVTDATGVVMALDKNTGSTLWKNSQVLYRGVTAPAELGDWLVVGDFEGYLHVLSREDGALAARLGTDGSPIMLAPVELSGGLLVQTSGGELYSIKVE
jgi:outer membrane protein assembly factor BamB